MSANVYHDAICLPKPQITNFYQNYTILKVLCDLTLLGLLLSLCFPIKEKSVFYVFFSWKDKLSIYLSVVHSFCLAGGWTLTFSCYSTDLFVTEIISLTQVFT